MKNLPEKAQEKEKVPEKFTPQAIYDFLNQYVIGQEQAKKVLSSAAAIHYRRAEFGFFPPPYEERPKSNVLLIGPTGTGKTRMIELLAKYIGIPAVTVDATSFSETGYVGKEVEEMVLELLKKAEYDSDRAATGIIHIDEIDKIAKTQDTHNHDISREGVQRGLLRLLESSQVTLKDNEYPGGENTWEINTENILFILSGAFEGLQEITATRLKNKSGMGFQREVYSQEKLISAEPAFEDLVAYGFSSQLLGRVPYTTTLKSLTEEDFYQILILPSNGLVQKKIEDFYLFGTHLEFTQEAFKAWAKKAYASQQKMGARALRRIADETLDIFLFAISSGRIQMPHLIVDEKLIEQPKEILADFIKKYSRVKEVEEAVEEKKVMIEIKTGTGFLSLENKINLLPLIYQHQLELLGVPDHFLQVAAAYGKEKSLPPKMIMDHIKKMEDNTAMYLRWYEKNSGIKMKLSEEAKDFLIEGCFREGDMNFGQKKCREQAKYLPLEFLKKQGIAKINVSLGNFFNPERLRKMLMKKKKKKKITNRGN